MFAQALRPSSVPAGRRLAALVSRVFHAVDHAAPAGMPVELQRLPDRLLIDLGVEPHRVRQPTTDAAVRPELIGREWP